MVIVLGLLCVIILAVGFVVLHLALKYKTSELKAAGWSLVIGGLVSLFAMFYYGPFLMVYGPMVGMRMLHHVDHNGAKGRLILEAPPRPK